MNGPNEVKAEQLNELNEVDRLDELNEVDGLDDLDDLNGRASNAGYGAEADALAVQYESVAFADVHRDMLHLFPQPPAAVLDIGAGTGRDAAALAALGHPVVAAEPTPELRRIGEQLHADSGIRWVDDALPALPSLGAARFDLVLLTAVWMHLAPAERPPAMQALARVLAPGGRVVLSLRHGLVPSGRRMFDVPPDETITLAATHRLRLLHRTARADLHARPGVHWTVLAFESA
ncbi:class I SAM-dependent methyltransferase [Kitasatospora aureofaciens]|uniref:class I SAM-dependent methyltransferase n=1 Tax=Kitasatospora aureofaciens TaxID=1894 RepID=UPI0027E15BCB|nr:class I SAM-dependent methyltransferase [Kitasatospora aureofaciens]